MTPDLDLRSLLEHAYFVAGIATAVFAYLALRKYTSSDLLSGHWYSLQVRGHVSRLPWCRFNGWSGSSTKAKFTVREGTYASTTGLPHEYQTPRTIDMLDVVDYTEQPNPPHPFVDIGPRPM